jgi:hypothetical protein
MSAMGRALSGVRWNGHLSRLQEDRVRIGGNLGTLGTLERDSATVQKKFILCGKGRNDVPNVPYSILGIVLCQVNLGFYGVMSI